MWQGRFILPDHGSGRCPICYFLRCNRFPESDPPGAGPPTASALQPGCQGALFSGGLHRGKPGRGALPPTRQETGHAIQADPQYRHRGLRSLHRHHALRHPGRGSGGRGHRRRRSRRRRQFLRHRQHVRRLHPLHRVRGRPLGGVARESPGRPQAGGRDRDQGRDGRRAGGRRPRPEPRPHAAGMRAQPAPAADRLDRHLLHAHPGRGHPGRGVGSGDGGPDRGGKGPLLGDFQLRMRADARTCWPPATPAAGRGRCCTNPSTAWSTETSRRT